jgi:hypothetical protein
MGRRKRGEEPQMRFHSHSGQARVRVDGKVIYLGPWDSPEAMANYHRLLVEWHGRVLETRCYGVKDSGPGCPQHLRHAAQSFAFRQIVAQAGVKS